MASEKPPGRSNPGKEPLTIDLEAEKDRTLQRRGSGRPDATPGKPGGYFDERGGGSRRVRTGEVESNEAASRISFAGGAIRKRKAETEEARADAAAAAFDAELPHATNGELPGGKSRQATGAGALAAGILGGLIALAGAACCNMPATFRRPDRSSRVPSRTLRARSKRSRRSFRRRPPAAAVDVAPLEDRLAALEQAAGSPRSCGGRSRNQGARTEVANLNE